MNKKDIKKIKSQEGITLFVTLVLMGVLLGVSASLLNITLKQYQLAGVSYASEVAFQAANAGMECALYLDWVDKEFDVGLIRDSVTCFETIFSPDTGHTVNPLVIDNGDNVADSREEQRFQFTWSSGADTVCTEFSVYKFYSDSLPVPVLIDGVDYKNGNECPVGSVCTVIQSRGYNVGCGAPLTSGARVVEREYTQVY